LTGRIPNIPNYALGSVYGKEGWGLEGEDLEEFQAGYEEKQKRLAESEKLREQAVENIREYESTLAQYAKDNGLTEEQSSEVHNGIVQLADNLLMGIIPAGIIDLVYKGMNYEKDMDAAVNTGRIQGLGEKIDAKLKKPESKTIPDLGNATGAGKNIPRAPRGGLGFPGD
jgi:hypothetical protein